MMQLGSTSLLAALIVVSLATTSSLALATDSLEAGLERFEALEYDEAIPLLESALLSETLEPRSRAKAAIHLGIIRLAYGEADAAKTSFVRALELDPEIGPPEGASPHITELYREARALAGLPEKEPSRPKPAVEERRGLMRHNPPARGFGRATLEIELDPARQVGVERILLRYRNKGESFWFDDQARSAGPNRYEAELPGPSLTVSAVEYYLQAIGVDGEPVDQVGSAATPMSYRAPEAPVVEEVAPTPIHTQWWFWTAVGTALVTGAVGAALLIGSDGEACAASDNRGCLRVEIIR